MESKKQSKIRRQKILQTFIKDGDELFAAEKYRDALDKYADAMWIERNDINLYEKLASCHLMLTEPHLSIKCYLKAMSINSTCYSRFYAKIIHCYIVLGDIREAEAWVRKIKNMRLDWQVLEEEIQQLNTLRELENEAEDCYREGSYAECLDHVEKALQISKLCLTFKLRKAECLVFLGHIKEATAIALPIYLSEKKNGDSIYVYGLILLHEGDLEGSMKRFQHAMSCNHTKTKLLWRKLLFLKGKITKADKALEKQKLLKAVHAYGEALRVDPTLRIINSRIHYSLGIANMRLGKLQCAIHSFTEAITRDEKFFMALLERAKCYAYTENFQLAMRDCQGALKTDSPDENQRTLLQETIALLEQIERKAHCTALRDNPNENVEEFKKIFCMYKTKSNF